MLLQEPLPGFCFTLGHSEYFAVGVSSLAQVYAETPPSDVYISSDLVLPSFNYIEWSIAFHDCCQDFVAEGSSPYSTDLTHTEMISPRMHERTLAGSLSCILLSEPALCCLNIIYHWPCAFLVPKIFLLLLHPNQSSYLQHLPTKKAFFLLLSLLAVSMLQDKQVQAVSKVFFKVHPRFAPYYTPLDNDAQCTLSPLIPAYPHLP